MWFDSLPVDWSWASLWYGYVVCSRCAGIRRLDALCPACQSPIPSVEPVKLRFPDGREEVVPQAFMGAEGRYEDYVYLKTLEREWKRPLSNAESPQTSGSKQPAARAVIVIVFWTYFETRIERLLRSSMHNLPERIAEDLLRRYASIGSRLDRLYTVLFNVTYWEDLQDSGFRSASALLQRIHQKRNEFAHGSPDAIDDKLVEDLVAGLQDEHESWIALFNKRATRSIA